MRPPDAPPLPRAQVILKKNQKKPYTRKSFTFKKVVVASARSHMNHIWLQEKGDMVKEALDILYIYKERGFPDPHLMNADDVIELFLKRYLSKQIGKEFVGHDGKPGFAWPPLSDHDANHDFLLGVLPPAATSPCPRAPCAAPVSSPLMPLSQATKISLPR